MFQVRIISWTRFFFSDTPSRYLPKNRASANHLLYLVVLRVGNIENSSICELFPGLSFDDVVISQREKDENYAPKKSEDISEKFSKMFGQGTNFVDFHFHFFFFKVMSVVRKYTSRYEF